jgi:hypothetical protein
MKDVFIFTRNILVEYDIFFLLSVISLGMANSLILRWFYIKYGKAKTNRTVVADSFPLLIISIILIIYLIKSSLVLSLGLVGALSIVRFRAAIKEPEELVYLLFAISIGLGLGAKQLIPVMVIFPIALIFIYIKDRLYGTSKIGEIIILNIKLNSNVTNDNVLEEWTRLVSNKSKECELQRYEDNSSEINATFIIHSIDVKDLVALKISLKDYKKDTELVLIDNSRPLIL